MTPSSIPWGMFRTLLRLRYQLLWTQSRSSAGKAVFFIALYVLGMLVFLFLALGGLSAALAAVHSGRGLQVARGILAGVLVSGLVTGLALGAGPRAAFSDGVLRRYPMTSKERLAARHMIGLLDPIWPLLLAVTAGLAAGFAIGNPWWLLVGLPAAALYASLIYLITVAILSLVDRVLQHKSGSAVLGFALVLLMNGILLIQPVLLGSHNRSWLGAIDRILGYLPPGAAASLIAGAGPREAVIAACALIVWGALPVFVLYRIENLPPVAEEERPGGIQWDSPLDKAAGWFGSGIGPLVAKWLRSFLRSQQVRFGLAAAIPVTVGLPWLPSRGGRTDKVYLTTVAVYFMLGALASGMASTNMFGLDRQGIRRYLILPVSLERVHRAGSIAALLLGAAMLPPAIIVSIAFGCIPLDARLILLPVLTAVAGIFYFNSVGLWTTVLAPFPVDPRNLLGNRAPVPVVLMQLASFQPAMVAMLYLRENGSVAMILDYSWLLCAAVLVSAAAYAISLSLTGRLLKARCERIIARIEGK